MLSARQCLTPQRKGRVAELGGRAEPCAAALAETEKEATDALCLLPKSPFRSPLKASNEGSVFPSASPFSTYGRSSGNIEASVGLLSPFGGARNGGVGNMHASSVASFTTSSAPPESPFSSFAGALSPLQGRWAAHGRESSDGKSVGVGTSSPLQESGPFSLGVLRGPVALSADGEEDRESEEGEGTMSVLFDSIFSSPVPVPASSLGGQGEAGSPPLAKNSKMRLDFEQHLLMSPNPDQASAMSAFPDPHWCLEESPRNQDYHTQFSAVWSTSSGFANNGCGGPSNGAISTEVRPFSSVNPRSMVSFSEVNAGAQDMGSQPVPVAKIESIPAPHSIVTRSSCTTAEVPNGKGGVSGSGDGSVSVDMVAQGVASVCGEEDVRLMMALKVAALGQTEVLGPLPTGPLPTQPSYLHQPSFDCDSNSGFGSWVLGPGRRTSPRQLQQSSDEKTTSNDAVVMSEAPAHVTPSRLQAASEPSSRSGLRQSQHRLMFRNSAPASSPSSSSSAIPSEESSRGSSQTDDNYSDDERPSNKARGTASLHLSAASPGSIHCGCKKSRCLKLYCDCFASNEYCNKECGCNSCHNTVYHEEERTRAVKSTLDRRPAAFQEKITRSNGQTQLGCRCKKSACLKKYCECFRVGLTCGVTCVCDGCQNMAPTPSEDSNSSPAVLPLKKKISHTAVIVASSPEPSHDTFTSPTLKITASGTKRATSGRYASSAKKSPPHPTPSLTSFAGIAKAEFTSPTPTYAHTAGGKTPAPTTASANKVLVTPQLHPVPANHDAMEVISCGESCVPHVTPDDPSEAGELWNQSVRQLRIVHTVQTDRLPTALYASPSTSVWRTSLPESASGTPRRSGASYVVGHTPTRKKAKVLTPVVESVNSQQPMKQQQHSRLTRSSLRMSAALLSEAASAHANASSAGKSGHNEGPVISAFGTRPVVFLYKGTITDILSYLDNDDLYNACLVSKLWSQLSLDEALWEY